MHQIQPRKSMIKRLSVRYAPHLVFSSAEDNAKVWRYMDFTKFVSLLDGNALFFSRADQLSDAWEGAHPVENRHRRPEVFDANEEEAPMIMEATSRFNRSLRLHTFMSCWHVNN